MLEWTKYQAEHNNVHTRYERVNMTLDLQHACTKVYNYIIHNNLKFHERPLTPLDYSKIIARYPYEFNCNLPEEQLEKWFNDPKYKTAVHMTMKDINDTQLPDEIVQPVYNALAVQENVYEGAMRFRVIKLEPGDQIMLHYDPKTFYWNSIVRQTEHRGKYIDKRAFVYMDDRRPGQVSYLGKDELDFKRNDMYKYDAEKLYHGSCNFGYDDRVMVCLSWAEPI